MEGNRSASASHDSERATGALAAHAARGLPFERSHQVEMCALTPEPDLNHRPEAGRRTAGRVSGAACAALWAIFLPATIVCAVVLGYRAAKAEQVTLPNLLVWSMGLCLVIVQSLLLAATTRAYLHGRKNVAARARKNGSRS